MTPEQRVERARKAALAGRDPDYRRGLKAAQLERRIVQAITCAPVLNLDQRRQLARLLLLDGGDAA